MSMRVMFSKSWISSRPSEPLSTTWQGTFASPMRFAAASLRCPATTRYCVGIPKSLMTVMGLMIPCARMDAARSSMSPTWRMFPFSWMLSTAMVRKLYLRSSSPFFSGRASLTLMVIVCFFMVFLRLLFKVRPPGAVALCCGNVCGELVLSLRPSAFYSWHPGNRTPGPPRGTKSPIWLKTRGGRTEPALVPLFPQRKGPLRSAGDTAKREGRRPVRSGSRHSARAERMQSVSLPQR